MRRIFLIRHGQTAWNRDQIFRGTLDIPLNDFGKEQARQLGRALKRRQVLNPVLASSPLLRARETAELAGEAVLCKEIATEQGFTDLNFGVWQGKAKADVEKLYPDLYRQWLDNPADIIFPGGEALRRVADRAGAALRRLAGSGGDRDLIIVSHRVVNKVLLCGLLGAGLDAFWKIKQDTACINLIEYSGGSFKVKTINDSCHLASLAGEETADF